MSCGIAYVGRQHPHLAHLNPKLPMIHILNSFWVHNLCLSVDKLETKQSSTLWNNARVETAELRASLGKKVEPQGGTLF